MVDPSKKKKKKKKKKKGGGSSSKKKSSSSSSSSSTKGGGSGEPDVYEVDAEDDINVDDATVSDTSKRWASDESELNYPSQGGEGERAYMQRQIEECDEFYDNFVEMAMDKIEDINQFALVYHALALSFARNRTGVVQVLKQNYDNSEKEAQKKADKIMAEAGEYEAMVKLFREVSDCMRNEWEESL